jgi:hypothetical protein
MTSCIVVVGYQRFGGACCLSLQDARICSKTSVTSVKGFADISTGTKNTIIYVFFFTSLCSLFLASCIFLFLLKSLLEYKAGIRPDLMFFCHIK